MKKSILIFTSILMLMAGSMLPGCSSDNNTKTEQTKKRKPIADAVDAGHRDAAKVLACDDDTHSREKAIFDIRAREHSLREAGHNDAADDYIAAAYEVLHDKINI